MEQIHQPCTLHGAEPAAVSVGRSCNSALFLQKNSAFHIHRRCHFLHKEMYIFRIIAEILHFLEKGTGILVIFFAGHHKQRHKCTCLIHDFHEVSDEAFKNVQFPGDADVEHALRLVKAQTGTHSACKEDGTDLALTDGVKSGSFKSVTVLRNFFQRQCAEGGKLSSFLLAAFAVICKYLQKLCVQFFDLLQEGFLFTLGQCIVPAQQMGLSACSQFFFCFVIVHGVFSYFQKQASEYSEAA